MSENVAALMGLVWIVSFFAFFAAVGWGIWTGSAAPTWWIALTAAIVFTVTNGVGVALYGRHRKVTP